MRRAGYAKGMSHREEAWVVAGSDPGFLSEFDVRDSLVALRGRDWRNVRVRGNAIYRCTKKQK